jgi:hypothetical protein
MKCPGCGFEQADGRIDCEMCGLVFEKWRQRHPAPSALAEISAQNLEPSLASIKPSTISQNRLIQKYHPGVFGWIFLSLLLIVIVAYLFSFFLEYWKRIIYGYFIFIPAVVLCIFLFKALHFAITINKPPYLEIINWISASLFGVGLLFYFAFFLNEWGYVGMLVTTLPAFGMGLILMAFNLVHYHRGYGISPLQPALRKSGFSIASNEPATSNLMGLKRKFHLGILGWISVIFFTVALLAFWISDFFTFYDSYIFMGLISIPAMDLGIAFLALEITSGIKKDGRVGSFFILILNSVLIFLFCVAIIYHCSFAGNHFGNANILQTNSFAFNLSILLLVLNTFFYHKNNGHILPDVILALKRTYINIVIALLLFVLSKYLVSNTLDLFKHQFRSDYLMVCFVLFAPMILLAVLLIALNKKRKPRDGQTA